MSSRAHAVARLADRIRGLGNRQVSPETGRLLILVAVTIAFVVWLVATGSVGCFEIEGWYCLI
jgi:hypothetical protein